MWFITVMDKCEPNENWYADFGDQRTWEYFVNLMKLTPMPIIRDCHKCVHEVGCHGNPVGCKDYKRDAPDGGYYG